MKVASVFFMTVALTSATHYNWLLHGEYLPVIDGSWRPGAIQVVEPEYLTVLTNFWNKLQQSPQTEEEFVVGGCNRMRLIQKEFSINHADLDSNLAQFLNATFLKGQKNQKLTAATMGHLNLLAGVNGSDLLYIVDESHMPPGQNFSVFQFFDSLFEITGQNPSEGPLFSKTNPLLPLISLPSKIAQPPIFLKLAAPFAVVSISGNSVVAPSEAGAHRAPLLFVSVHNSVDTIFDPSVPFSVPAKPEFFVFERIIAPSIVNGSFSIGVSGFTNSTDSSHLTISDVLAGTVNSTSSSSSSQSEASLGLTQNESGVSSNSTQSAEASNSTQSAGASNSTQSAGASNSTQSAEFAGLTSATSTSSSQNATGASSTQNATGASSTQNMTGASSSENATDASTSTNLTASSSSANATDSASSTNAAGSSSASNATASSSSSDATGSSSSNNSTGSSSSAQSGLGSITTVMQSQNSTSQSASEHASASSHEASQAANSTETSSQSSHSSSQTGPSGIISSQSNQTSSSSSSGQSSSASQSSSQHSASSNSTQHSSSSSSKTVTKAN